MNNMKSTTPIIDHKIMTINEVICRHLASFDNSTRGMMSQDILAQLRTFVEHICLKIYANGIEIENSYENICNSLRHIEAQGKFKDLRRFHEFLQIVASHYTLDEDNSERLMLKYFEYLCKIKKMLHDKYSLDVLENLSCFPLNTDKTLQEYYEKIAEKVYLHQHRPVEKSEKFYIQKIKPFFVNQNVLYEITLTPANDHSSKFNRVIAFSSLEICSNYACKFVFINDNINLLEKTMPIVIIVGYEVAIRDCEYKNFSRFIVKNTYKMGYSEQL